jgi:chromosome segregation ATPase
MATEIDRLFTMLAEGIEKASPTSLIGETHLKIEQLREKRAASSSRASEYRSELDDTSSQIEQGESLDSSELENLLARQRMFQQRVSLSTAATESRSAQLREAESRLGALTENYKQCLMKLRSIEADMSSFTTEEQYRECLTVVLSSISELVGPEASPTPQQYVQPPEARCAWL